MSHPSLVRLSDASRPRLLFSGESLGEVVLPAGARVLYPRRGKALMSSAIITEVRQALLAPLGAESFPKRVRGCQRVVVVLDSGELPQRRASDPDPRACIVEEVVRQCVQAEVRDVRVLVACGLERRRTAAELAQLIGKALYRKLGKERVASHDPEGSDLVALSEMGAASPVKVSSWVRDADLIVTVGLQGGQHSGLGGPVLRGIGDAAAYLRACDAGSLNDALPEEEAAWAKLPVFALEAVLSGSRLHSSYDFLALNEDDLGISQRRALSLFQLALRRLPQAGKRRLLDDTLATPELSRVFAGDRRAARAAALAAWVSESEVQVGKPVDVLLAAIPHRTALNAGTFLNPVLLGALTHAGMGVRPGGKSLVRPGGAIVVLHPCSDSFDRHQHAAHYQFFNDALPRSRDLVELRNWTAQKAMRDPALLQMFRNAVCQHPLHAYVAWAAGVSARKSLERVIVVGADNEHVPHMLGFESAETLEQALYRARAGRNTAQDILCLHSPVNTLGSIGTQA